MAALTSLLVQHAVSWLDGGGKVPSNLKPIHGEQAVARFSWFRRSLARKTQRPLTFTLAEINGSPAISFWEEGSLTVTAVGIQEAHARLNSEKLSDLQSSSPAPEDGAALIPEPVKGTTGNRVSWRSASLVTGHKKRSLLSVPEIR